jgi:hypothetical protein
VSQGAIECRNGIEAVFVADDRVYALNGAASQSASQRGYLELAEIWLDNPDIPGTKINISPMIDLALEQC